MPELSPPMKTIGRRLLDWDVARVEKHKLDGFDVSAYAARQQLAEACLEIDPDEWPQEVRFLYMAVLEVIVTKTKARQVNIGRLTLPVVSQPTPEEFAGYRAFARAIAVIDRLKEVAPIHWTEAV